MGSVRRDIMSKSYATCCLNLCPSQTDDEFVPVSGPDGYKFKQHVAYDFDMVSRYTDDSSAVDLLLDHPSRKSKFQP